VTRGEQTGGKTGEAGADDYDVIVGHGSLGVSFKRSNRSNVQAPSFVLPRVAGEERGGGWNRAQRWNG
jgi:hypothetical protein